jgi:hypothetical protein
MLPFLKRKDESGASAPVDPAKQMITRDEDDLDHDHLEVAMEELSHALKAEDYKAAAEAFRAAFDLLEVQPHDEYPHDEEQ